MIKRHSENERIKRRYVLYLKDAKGRDEASIDAATAAIERFEDYNRRRDFKAFHIEQARAFKAHLAAARSSKTDKPLSASTVCSTLGALKAFFVWLADQPGYASKIRYADADYFNPPDNLSRTAGAQRYVEFPTLPQVRAMLDAMPAETEIQKRDRALIAFAILTGARDRAIVSFSLKHVDLERDVVMQDAREVRTKRAKTFETWLFPVGADIRQILADWIDYLRTEKGFGPNDPLFPKAKIEFAANEEYRAVSIDRAPWANANRVREIFRDACARGNPLFQSAFDPEDARATRVRSRPWRGSLQGLVAKSRSRKLPDYVLQLRDNLACATSGDHPKSGSAAGPTGGGASPAGSHAMARAIHPRGKGDGLKQEPIAACINPK